MSQAIGRVRVIVDGRIIDIEKGAKLKLGGVKRTAKPTDGGRVHYSEETEAAELECKVVPTADCPIETYRAFAGALIQFEGDNGLRYQVRNGFTTESIDLGGGESFTLKMAGEPAEKL